MRQSVTKLREATRCHRSTRPVCAELGRAVLPPMQHGHLDLRVIKFGGYRERPYASRNLLALRPVGRVGLSRKHDERRLPVLIFGIDRARQAESVDCLA